MTASNTQQSTPNKGGIKWVAVVKLSGRSMVGSGVITGTKKKNWCMLLVDAVVTVAAAVNLCEGGEPQPRKTI